MSSEHESQPTRWQLPELSTEDTKRLIGGPFGDILCDLVMSYSTTVGFATPIGGAELDLSISTAFAIRTRSRLLLVTAGHVYDGYLAAKSSAPQVGCQIGNIPFDLERCLISRGRKLDIATFSITDDELTQLGKRAIPYWPPAEPKPGQHILYVGAPAVGRVKLAPRNFKFGALVGMGNIREVLEDKFTTQIDRRELIDDPERPPLPPGTEMGGMSGGPVLGLVGKTVITYQLCGLIKEAYAAADYFIMSRADAIDDAGKILG